MRRKREKKNIEKSDQKIEKIKKEKIIKNKKININKCTNKLNNKNHFRFCSYINNNYYYMFSKFYIRVGY